MDTNESAIEFIEGLSLSCNKALNFQTDVDFLIYASFQEHKVENLHNAAFTAKYISGLKRVMQAGAGNPEIHNMAAVESDVMENFLKLISILRDIVPGEEFDAKFLNQTEESFSNLQGLVEDLSQVKVYFNLLKRVAE